MSAPGHSASMLAPLFGGMGTEIIRLAGRPNTTRNYRRGELIFQQGELVDGCFVVVEGGVKIYRERPDGEHIVISVISKG